MTTGFAGLGGGLGGLGATACPDRVICQGVPGALWYRLYRISLPRTGRRGPAPPPPAFRFHLPVPDA